MNIESIIREYIDKSIHMSLATCVDNKPWVCEVHFVYDQNLNIYWRSKESRRHSQEIAVNTNVAGNIVKQHELGEYPHAVYFEGTAGILNEPEEQKKIFSIFQNRIGVSAEAFEEMSREDGHKIYKITVDNWYAFGKFGGDSGHKYHLPWNGGNK